jgi:hypothetical protein
MKRPSFILRLAAFVLLAVFSQKMGGGLLVHNLFHAQTSIPGQQDDKNKDINYACSCVDDFLMPFDEAGDVYFTAPITVTIAGFSILPAEVFTYPTFHFSRRGPPSVNC